MTVSTSMATPVDDIFLSTPVDHVHVASIYAPLCVVVNSAMIMNDKMTTVHLQAAVFILGTF